MKDLKPSQLRTKHSSILYLEVFCFFFTAKKRRYIANGYPLREYEVGEQEATGCSGQVMPKKERYILLDLKSPKFCMHSLKF